MVTIKERILGRKGAQIEKINSADANEERVRSFEFFTNIVRGKNTIFLELNSANLAVPTILENLLLYGVQDNGEVKDKNGRDLAGQQRCVVRREVRQALDKVSIEDRKKLIELLKAFSNSDKLIERSNALAFFSKIIRTNGVFLEQNSANLPVTTILENLFLYGVQENGEVKDKNGRDLAGQQRCVVRREVINFLSALTTSDKNQLIQICRTTQKSETNAKRGGNISFFADIIRGKNTAFLEQNSANLSVPDILENLLLYGIQDNGEVKDKNGTDLAGQQRCVVRNDVRQVFLQLKSKDRKILFEYVRFLRDPKAGSDSEKASLKLLLAGDLEMVARRPGDFESKTLKEAVVFARCLKTQVDFEKALRDKNNNSSKLLELALSASQETEKDREVRSGLVEQAVFARRQEILTQLEAFINRKEIDKAIELMQSLFRQEIKTDDDTKLAVSFAEALYRLELKNAEQQVTNILLDGGTLEETKNILEELGKKVRPEVAGIVYVEEIKRIRASAETLYKTTRFLRVEKVRKLFAQQPVGQILLDIKAFPIKNPNFGSQAPIDESKLNPTNEDIALQLLLLDEFEAYVIQNRKGEYEASRPGNFSLKDEIKKFRAEIESRKLKDTYEPRERGQNIEGVRYVQENFRTGAWNAFRALASSEFPDEKLTQAVWDEGGDMALRSKYRYTLEKLQEQRRSVGQSLSELETMYFRSVELMSKVNPYLVALAQEEPAITDEFLRAHFDKKSEETWNNIQEGTFIPQVVVGMGPNAISFMGEMARSNPKLAEQTLTVDVADYPGGPFAIPAGNAFQLNSANAEKGITLADDVFSGPKTLQGFQPGTGFPGERVQGGNRSDRGSINSPVGWGIRPDFYSEQRYPSNDEMVRTISLMSSVVLRNPCTKTYALPPKKVKDKTGTYEITLVRKNKNGQEERKTVYTDICVGALGLGNRFYGYDLEGTQTKEILTGQKKGINRAPKDGGDYVTHTLDLLEEIDNEREEPIVLPETIVLSGSGDSTAIALEKISGLFTGGAQNRKVRKVYIVGSQDDLSKRPRYAYIKDLLSRPGEENGRLVEFIDLGKSGDRQNKLTDVRFATRDELSRYGYIGDEQKLVLLGPDKKPVTQDGKLVLVDKYVANTGFRNGASDFFRNLTGSIERRELYSGKTGKFENVTLPTNPGIVVGRKVKGEQAYAIGVSAELPFGQEFLETVNPNTSAKITTLAVVNKVSIGVNAPASGATAQIINETNDFELPENNWANNRRERQTFSTQGELFNPGEGYLFKTDEALSRSYGTSSEVKNPSKLLSTLLATTLQDYEFSEKDKMKIVLSFNLDKDNNLVIRAMSPVQEATDQNIKMYVEKVNKAFVERLGFTVSNDPYFARYFTDAIMNRGNRAYYGGAIAKLIFQNGKYLPQESAIQI